MIKTHEAQPPASLLSLVRGDASTEDDTSQKGKGWSALGEPAKLIKTEDMEFRDYQSKIIASIFSGKNTLVIVPTGKGKTVMEIFSAAKAISEGKKALFVASTRPLVEQHYNESANAFRDNGRIAILTGETRRKDRDGLSSKADIIIATPETVLNEAKKGNLKLDVFGMLIIDECQRTRGEYAYTHLARMFRRKDTQIVAFTGSLSSRTAVADSIIEALGIENIQVREKSDSDIMHYMMPVNVRKIVVEKSETMLAVEKRFQGMMNVYFESMRKVGLVGEDKGFEEMPRAEFMKIRSAANMLMGKVYNRELEWDRRDDAIAGVKSFYKLMYMSHAYDLLETQGFGPTLDYLKQLKGKKGKSKSLSELLENSSNLKEAARILERALDSGEEHPKLGVLVDSIKANGKDKVMVFVHYRPTVKMIVRKLRENGIESMPFMGKKEGITDKQQRQTLEDYSKSKFKVLVSTLIGEEGIDIKAEPSLVICYDTVPSAIRNVQRKGRTGRNMPGNAIILVTKGTKDEAYYNISAWREYSMERITKKLRHYSAPAATTEPARTGKTETANAVQQSKPAKQLDLFDFRRLETFEYPD
ncbi:MAG: DEAD/DEAH box helicase [Candidatus Micrarchaeota archaeon]|nr:DEAD/DEAH box helicase [Candidatus Micrarchaeota archaeon]